MNIEQTPTLNANTSPAAQETKKYFNNKKKLYFAYGFAAICIILFSVTAIILALSTGSKQTQDITGLDRTTKTTTTNVVSNTPTTNTSVKIGNYEVELAKELTTEKLDVFKSLTQKEYNSIMSEYDPSFGGEAYIAGDNDTNYNYFNVGKVTSTEYKDFTLYYGFQKDYNFFSTVIPIMKKENTTVVFDAQKNLNDPNPYSYSFIKKEFLQSTVTISDDTSIATYLKTDILNMDKISGYTINTMPIISTTNLLESTAQKNGSKTYLKTDDVNNFVYVKATDNFYRAHLIQPNFYTKMTSGNVTLNITWSKDKTGKNKYEYDYIGIGSCSAARLEVAKVTDTELIEIGKTSDNDPVYEYKDTSKDSFLSKVYNEDYKVGDINKYNTIKEDDAKIFTLAQTIKYHPVFYWKDPWNRYIKFASREFVLTGGCAKPAIYLYPTSTTNVNVNLDIKGTLVHTYPKYNTGWNVLANPNGDLAVENKIYDYLFWDGQFNGHITQDKGWIVNKSEINNFLNTKLSDLGFNAKEKGQFIEYWLPIIQREQKPYIFISFVDETVMDYYAPLSITPKADSYKRYFMLFRGEDNMRTISAPTFPSFERKGFFVFEWGGSRI